MIRNLLLLVCLCAWLPAAAHPYAVEQIENVQSADRTRFTSNPDGILSQAAVARIDSICYGLRRRGAAQVAVVAVDAIAGGDPFTFAYELFSKWGVGRREDSNGVGILLVREQREIRFVTGRGVEGVLPDALCKRIQTNYMLPAFREGDYDRGMVRGVEAVAAVLAGSELETGVPDAVPQEDDTPWWVIALIVGGCVAVPLVAVVRMLRCPRCKRWFALRSQGERIVLRAEGWRMVEQTLVCRRCGETIRRRRREADGSDIGGRGGGGHGHAAALGQRAPVPALGATAFGLLDAAALTLELRDFPLQLLEGGALLLQLCAKDPQAGVAVAYLFIQLDAIGVPD